MDEIDVTPEMIEAGAAEVGSYDERFEGFEAVAERVWIAMETVHREQVDRIFDDREA